MPNTPLTSAPSIWRDAENPTSGKWYHRGHEILADQSAPGARFAKLVAVIEPGLHALADARLIAAAKELGEALHLARAILDRVDASQMIPGNLADDVRLASRLAVHALAKSEGR